MTVPEMLIAGLIGLTAGVLGGLAGIGGSIVMLPGLALLLGYSDEAKTDQHLYMAASMSVNVLVAVPAAIRHHIAGVVRIDAVRVILPTMACAILVGVWLSDREPGVTLRLLLAVFIAAYCVLNLVRLVRKKGETTVADERTDWHRLVTIGAITGLVAGLLGIGGGVLMVPMLQIFCRLPLRQSIGTSSAVMCLTALVGAIGKMSTLHTHGLEVGDALLLVLALGPTAMVGAWIGAKLTHKLPLPVVRGVISVLLLIAAIKMAELI